MADHFHSFIQNLTVAVTRTTNGAAVISLPRSQVEMTDWDMQWQEKITKVVRRVAKDLIANDETEISEVVRRRLFDELGSERARKNVSRTYAEWCFEHRTQLPREWTAVDSTATEARVIPKLCSGSDLKINVSFSVTVDEPLAQNFQTELKQILTDLDLYARSKIE